MLESWDFIDVKLAQKIQSIERQIKSILRQRKAIENNTKTTSQTKNKLLQYNHKCLTDTQQLLYNAKEGLTEYLDKQIICLSNKTSSLSPNKHIVPCKQRKIYYREKRNTSFNKSYENLNSTHNQTNIHNSIVQSSSLNFKKAKRTKRTKYVSIRNAKNRKLYIKLNLMEIRLLESQELLELQRIKNYSLEKQCEEDNQLIQIQNKMVQVLKQKNRKMEEQMRDFKRIHQEKIKDIIKDHEKIQQIQQKNKELILERNLLLKSIAN